jgi:hypothetical protein
VLDYLRRIESDATVEVARDIIEFELGKAYF